ncbi:MAG TPA: cytochrome c-type biogenesis protein [Longimicrobiales bacterium]
MTGPTLGLVLVLGMGLGVPAFAQTALSDVALNERTHAIAEQLRCPVCQGLSLADSQSELSLQMREVIKDQLRAGKSDTEIIDYFVAKYGEWILLEPKARGFNLIAYLLPLLVLAAGVGVIYASVRKWTRAEPVATSSAV